MASNPRRRCGGERSMSRGNEARGCWRGVLVLAAYVTRSTKSFFTEGSIDIQGSYHISCGNNKGRPGRRHRGLNSQSLFCRSTSIFCFHSSSKILCLWDSPLVLCSFAKTTDMFPSSDNGAIVISWSSCSFGQLQPWKNFRHFIIYFPKQRLLKRHLHWMSKKEVHALGWFPPSLLHSISERYQVNVSVVAWVSRKTVLDQSQCAKRAAALPRQQVCF